MAQVQPEGDLRGILLPWDLREATLTATTEASPMPAVPSPAAATSMSVAMSGVPTVGESWLLSVGRAGVPEPVGGTFRARKSVSEEWRDWDPPTAISAWEFIDRSTSANRWSKPHAARLLNGRPIVVAVQDTDTVVAWYQSALGVWSSVTIEDTGAATCACVDVLPTGRVQCWYLREVVASTTTQIRMAYSDDGGVTWTVGSARCLFVPLVSASTSIKRLRVRYVNGNAIALLWYSSGGADYYWQYGSSDAGCTFYDVVVYQTADRGAPEIVVRNGEILIAWVEYDATLPGSSLIVPKLYRIGSVGTPFTSVEPVVAVDSTEVWEWGVYSGGRFTSAELAMMVDDDGVIYLYGVDFDGTSARELRCSRSYDGGTTWDTPIAAPEAVWSAGDTSTYPYDLAVTPERSRGLLLHRFAANPGTADDSLCAMYLGGWTTRALPWNNAYPWDQYVMGWDITWLPFDEPDNTGTTWLPSITGVPTSTLGAGGLTISQAGGETKSYYTNPASGGNGYGLCALIDVSDVTSGNGFIDLRISDNTNSYSVRVHWTTTAITLRDLVAGADLDSDTGLTLTAGLQVLVILQHPGADWTTASGHVRCAYRALSAVAGPSPDKEWTNLTGSTTLTSGGSATRLVQWGILSGAGQQTFRFLGYTDGASILDDTVAQSGFPTRGRTWCPPTSPAYVGRYGHRVQASGGPAYIGNTWSAPAAYGYPVTAVDPWRAPSPRVAWRSTATTQTDLTWTGVDKGIVGGDLIGIYLQGCNFATAALYADTGAVTKIADIDLKLATGLGFTRTRGLIYPTGGAGSDAGYWLHENALAGCWWQYSVGGTVRKIKGNTAGNFMGSAAATSYPRAHIELEIYGGGDSASGTGGIIWSDRVLVMTDIATSTDTLMLRIGAQTISDAYFTIGVCAIGRMYLYPGQYSQSRTVEVATGVIRSRGVGGSTVVSRPAPAARAWEMQWAEGIDQSKLYGSAAMDYYTLGYTSAPPVSPGRAALPTGLLGVLTSASPECPVAYAGAIPQPASAPTATAPIRIVDPARLGWAWIETETLRVDTVQGHEFASPDGEVARVGTIRFGEAQ